MRYENTGATESSEDYLEAILVRATTRYRAAAMATGLPSFSGARRIAACRKRAALASHHPFVGATPTFALTCTIFTMRKRSDAPMLSFVEGFSPVLSIWR